jgi:hypothetical protein
MNSKTVASKEEQSASPSPSLKQQAVMTLKVLAMTGAALGAIWVLDLLAAQ